MTDRVRASALELNSQKWFARSQVFNHAEILVSEQSTFSACWLDLRKRGELERLDYGKYRYNPERAPGANVKHRIYRAVHVKGAFCASDIAKLSEANISYVTEIIRGLVTAGYLEFTGKQGQVKFFRVRNSEKFYLDRVKE